MPDLSGLGRVEGKGVKLDCYRSDSGSIWLYVSGSKFHQSRWIVVPADDLIEVLTRDGKV